MDHADLKLHDCQCVNCQSAGEHPDKKLQQQMNLPLSRLDEQQRRWYVAVEANRIGLAGFVCCRKLRGWMRKPSSVDNRNWSRCVWLVAGVQRLKKRPDDKDCSERIS